MAMPLLSTKLYIPPVRVERVERARLLDKLDGALRPGVRLALISAPAGFGKTSLMVEWLERCGQSQKSRCVAWLALDAGDNHLDVFLSYLAAAIERAMPGAIPETAALLRASLSGAEPPRSDIILTGLVNELAGLDPSQPLIIALDDLQFISAPEVREALVFLVEQIPPTVRLAVATRSDPPLPLPRLRARGQMVELRAADLRFTNEEAADFLVRGMGLNLNVETEQDLIAMLTERTEGWAAGLQMAGLALQTGDRDPAELIRTFSGSHRFVLDYLAEEVLSRLPQDVVDFLLKTSVLDRFSASLCEAVVSEENKSSSPITDRPITDSLTTDHRPLSTISFLDQSNLFLVPLDGERQWFRYHHLFADLLRARLKQVRPGLERVIHQRAAAWFEQNNSIAEAIQHALAGQDFERAARLVETHCVALFRRGELHSLQKWVSLLPEALSAQRPLLSVYRAWVLVFAGQIDAIEPLLQQAESFLPELGPAEQRVLEGSCAAIRCHRLIISGKLAEGIALIPRVEEKLPDRSLWVRGFVDWSHGYALRLMGDLDGAAALFERCFLHDQSQGDPWGTAMNGNDLGVVRRQQGRLREAVEVFRSALSTVEAAGARRLGYTGRLLTALAAVQYDQNELGAARRSLEEAVALNQNWRNPNHLIYSYMNLARVEIAQGNYSAAEAMLQACEPVLRSMPVLPLLSRAVETGWINLRLAQGQVQAGEAVEGLVQAILAGAKTGLPFDEVRETQQSLAARVLVSQGRNQEAAGLLSVMEEAARTGGRVTMLMEVLAFKALALESLGQREAALQAIEEAAARAESTGAVRPVIDPALVVRTGALHRLLNALRQSSRVTPAYLERLIAALPDTGPVTAGTAQSKLSERQTPAKTPSAAPLVETLTEREMEVLRLLAQGLTNAQIAERLVITTGTVKAHTASIFRKLDAENRTQAVAKARDFGLLKA